MEKNLISYSSSDKISSYTYNDIPVKSKPTYGLRYPEENVNSSYNNLYKKYKTHGLRYPEEVNK